MGINEWNEEREALSAIFADDIVFSSDSWTTISLQVPLDADSAIIAGSFSKKPKDVFLIDGAKVQLDTWVKLAGDVGKDAASERSGCLYPNAVPLFAVKSTDLPPKAVMALTYYILVAADSMRWDREPEQPPSTRGRPGPDVEETDRPFLW